MFLLIALFSADASAWEVRLDSAGQEMMWRANDVPYSINASGDHGLSEAAINTLVAAATRSWVSPLEGKLTFTQGKQTNVRAPSYDDNVNAVFFDEEWDQDPSLLALTYVWSNTQGEILGFDLAVNATDHSWATDGRADANDLLNTLSHEIGHALGIDHSPDIAPATMYPSSPAGEVQKRDLHDDDVEAAIYLYGGTGDDSSKGCSSLPNARGAWTWAILIPFLLCLRHRERLP